MSTIEVKKHATLQGHTGAVYALSRSLSQADVIYSAGGDGMVVQWDISAPDNGKLIAKVPTNIFSMLQVDDTNMLLGQMQGGIHVLDMVTKQETRHLVLHTNGVFDLQLVAGNFLAAGGDGALSQWTVTEQNLLREIPVNDKSLRCIAVHPAQPIIAVGCSDNHVYILDAHTLVTIQKLEGHTGSVFTAVFSPDGRWLLTGSRDAQIIVWKVGENCEFYARRPAHLFTVNSIVYSPDGTLFATASRETGRPRQLSEQTDMAAPPGFVQ